MTDFINLQYFSFPAAIAARYGVFFCRHRVMVGCLFRGCTGVFGGLRACRNCTTRIFHVRGRVCAIRCCPCHFAGMSITHSGCVSVPVAQSFLRCQLRFRCALQCVLLAVIGLCWTRCNAGWRAVLDVSDKVCLVDSWRYPSGAACQNLTLKPVSKNYHFSQLCRLHFASVQSSDRLQKPMR